MKLFFDYLQLSVKSNQTSPIQSQPYILVSGLSRPGDEQSGQTHATYAPFYDKMSSLHAGRHYTREQNAQRKQIEILKEQMSSGQSREQNLT